ncbi:ABC transporter substrate-binding protein [Roseivivax sp. CAU 1761]
MKTFMYRTASAGAIVAAAATAAAAQDGATLTLADNVGIEANWALYSDDSYIAARAGCYEGLTRVSNSVAIEPALATEWRQVDDLTWEFTLRDGVTFQNGEPLTAEAAAGALTHLLEASIPARAFSPKVATSVTATGPRTVAITTVEPQANLPARMAAPATAILAPAAYTDSGIDPVNHCTGPFRITAWDTEQSVTLERFDAYWGGAAALAGGQIRFIPDANTRATMVRTGEVQIARLVPPTTVSTLSSTAGIEIAEVAAPRILELILQTSKPPFDNPTVRRAVRAAIDTAGISAAVYEGYAPPAGDPFRDGEPWEAANAPAIEANIEEAKALFEEAGVDPSTLELELLAYTSKTELKDISQIVQAMLSQLGITVNVRMADYGALEPDLMSGDFDLALMSRGYLTDVPEPIGFFSADYACEGGFNLSKFCDPALDEMIKAAAAETDSAARMSAYSEIAQFVYDQAVMVYIVNETVFDAVAKSVGGYTPHPLNYVVFDTDLTVE